MEEKRYAHGVSVGRPEYMKPPERPRSRWWDNSKMD
jgi:hypothetical protein